MTKVVARNHFELALFAAVIFFGLPASILISSAIAR